MANGKTERKPSRDETRALGHPMRIAILQELEGGGELTAMNYATAHALKLSRVAYHLRVLAEGKLAELGKSQVFTITAAGHRALGTVSP